MDLYDVKARGLHSLLNAREIGQLFRAGRFGRRQPCNPRGEATWRTIDELFPLLRYEAEAPPLRFDKPRRSRKRGPFISACALILALLGTAIFQCWLQSARQLPGNPTSGNSLRPRSQFSPNLPNRPPSPPSIDLRNRSANAPSLPIKRKPSSQESVKAGMFASPVNQEIRKARTEEISR